MQVGHPTIKQLKYLQTVIELKSFRQAALSLNVSQPTVTAQIAALEENLGLTLLERSRTGALPTAAARSMLPHIELMLDEVKAIRDVARFSLDSGAGIHRLGVPPTLGPYILPDIIPGIHKTYPDLRLFVREDSPREIENGLLDGQFDLIFTTLPLDVTGLTVEPLFGEPFRLCVAPDHELAKQSTVNANDITDQRLLAIEERHRLFEQMQGLANKYGARILRDYEGTSLDTVRQMVGTGIGIAFLPSLYVRSEIEPRKDVAVLELEDTPTDREVVLAWRPSAPQRHLYKELAAFIRSLCAKRLKNYLHVDL
ncbi:hydrogen peroxide-inducible genes activator [Pseudemcibacter aquimaris]|uniref:hydrogen peroxide-inducible genes activator n=1 Tax=Pseudemcibacter aquimaris TaxID=2857064 RepID=UPI0020119B2F|nr:hydrogen peroxide-inducible genes activator [Pseudemcibacter aquimaris]MCC3862508.1 hydrogen peroxide-inducible genes activator [Pseudemcibacter aquimaris]WDU57770.1 hydrogen peroxide-inducible genes activator [Pseudemcibacter aquimaris]